MNGPLLPGNGPCQRRLLYDVDHDEGQFRTNRHGENLARRHIRARLLTWPAVTGVALARAFRNVPYVDNWELTPMSSILFDYLLPLLGPEQAAYWAQVFMINPT
ncbi:hypothetical protein AB0C34_22565 [Nocardia sp. NPDC049220]|uniref:hypothetical protein n=1 Tax=Nocardia sp. NPDC049220 TaxID=3155273 RepID=UPI0034034F87